MDKEEAMEKFDPISFQAEVDEIMKEIDEINSHSSKDGRLNLDEALAAQSQFIAIDSEFDALLNTTDGTYFEVVLVPKEHADECVVLTRKTEVDDWLCDDPEI